jgi:hypothetical protein
VKSTGWGSDKPVSRKTLFVLHLQVISGVVVAEAAWLRTHPKCFRCTRRSKEIAGRGMSLIKTVTGNEMLGLKTVENVQVDVESESSLSCG